MRYRLLHSHSRIVWTVLVSTCLLALGLFFTRPASTYAQAARLPAAAPQTSAPQQSSDQSCRLCHSDSEQSVSLPSGEEIAVQIDVTVLDNSVHSAAEVACNDCHVPRDNYSLPHAPVTASDLRAYELERSATCVRCHAPVHNTSHPGLDAEEPVACTDCHGSHDVQPVADWSTESAVDNCVSCHEARNVATQNRLSLQQVINNGLFRVTNKQTSEYCLACHNRPVFTYTFPNGDLQSLSVRPDELAHSVHGESNDWQPLQCQDCHVDVEGYPHREVEAATKREYNLAMYTLCARCHEENYDKLVDNVHGHALAEGNENAAVCTDCHGNHSISDPDDRRQAISATCDQCHSTIFDAYTHSVHGTALMSTNNPDVPTCLECHGTHDINDPTTALARARSPLLCARCHADEELMARYDISTDVFETYVADFHGTTVTLFEHQDPDVETNKAVCYDCHGVHDIRPPDDPDAGIKANLLETCQQCHPNATANFSDAWTSHFVPSLDNNPLVYLVNLFYQIVIPLTVGVFAFLVFTDIYRQIRFRLRPPAAHRPAAQEPDDDQPAATEQSGAEQPSENEGDQS